MKKIILLFLILCSNVIPQDGIIDVYKLKEKQEEYQILFDRMKSMVGDYQSDCESMLAYNFTISDLFDIKIGTENIILFLGIREAFIDEKRIDGYDKVLKNLVSGYKDVIKEKEQTLEILYNATTDGGLRLMIREVLKWIEATKTILG